MAPRTEYDRLVKDTRAEYLPLRKAAEIASVWSKAAGRTAAELERELRALAVSGQLKSRGRGRSVEIESGSFDNWLGGASEPEPEWGWVYEPLPDAVYEHHATRRRILDDQQQRLAGGLSAPWLVLPTMENARFPRDESALTDEDRRVLAIAEGVRDGTWECWARLLAVEQVANEAVEQLQDEVVLPEILRDHLALIRRKLERLYEDAPSFVGELERPGAEPTILDMLYRGIEAQRGR